MSICIAILIEFLNGNVYFGWSWALGFGGLIADFSTASALATTEDGSSSTQGWGGGLELHELIEERWFSELHEYITGVCYSQKSCTIFKA